jgi:hypothetical protein
MATQRIAQRALKEGFMKAEDVQLGMLVQVHRGYTDAYLRDRIGIVRRRVGNQSHSPFEVRFKNAEYRRLRLLSAGEFEEAEEF